MSLSRSVVTAVRLAGRIKAEVARDYGVSPRWVYALVHRFDAEGEPALSRDHAGRWKAPSAPPKH
jgi:transposase